MTVKFEQISADEIAARYVATMQYRTGTINVNGEDRIAIDFDSQKVLFDVQDSPMFNIMSGTGSRITDRGA